MTRYNPDANDPKYGEDDSEREFRMDMMRERSIRRDDPDWYKVVVADPDHDDFGAVVLVTDDREDAEDEIRTRNDDEDGTPFDLGTGHEELDERPETTDL